MPEIKSVYCRKNGTFRVKFELKRENLLNVKISQIVAFKGKP